MSDAVAIPPETQRLLRLLNGHWNECVLRVGELEVRYSNDKDRLFAALKTVQEERQKLLDEVARSGGIDLQSERWLLDEQATTLTRDSSFKKG